MKRTRSNVLYSSQPVSSRPSTSRANGSKSNKRRQMSEEEDPRLEESITNCVRYVLLRAGSQLPIRSTDIKPILTKNFNVHTIMMEASVILKEVYGYNVELCDSQSMKYYVVSNNMPHIYLIEEDDEEATSKARKVLIMLVLAHIFMSNDNCHSASLYAFLESLDIPVEGNDKVFGNVAEFIKGPMVKQKLIEMETNTTSNKAMYRWGAKAENTISKMAVLEFVSRMYNKPPNTWTNQFCIAREQQRLVKGPIAEMD